MKSGRQSSEFPATVTLRRGRMASCAFALCLAVAGAGSMAGCADGATTAPTGDGLGVFRFALSAAVPGATHMKVHM